MSTEHTCQTCGKPLEQAETGRPRRYCSRRCKRKAARQRAASFGAFRRRESPVTAPVSAPSAGTRQAGTGPAGWHPPGARAKELARAVARVRNAEEQLQAAKAARAALEPEEREWPRAATYDGPEWLARNRDAIAPGRDTTEIAARITAAHEAERRQAS